MKFGTPVFYKGLPGIVIAKQFPLPVEGQPAGYLIAFKNPALKERCPARDHWALVLGLNPEAQLGPSCNRLILETELENVQNVNDN